MRNMLSMLFPVIGLCIYINTCNVYAAENKIVLPKDVISSVDEFDNDNDGELDGKITTFTRNGIKILVVREDYKSKTGNCRIYYLGGKGVLVESDKDGDGIYEILELLGDDYALEVFKKTGYFVFPMFDSASLNTIMEGWKKGVDKLDEHIKEITPDLLEERKPQKDSSLSGSPTLDNVVSPPVSREASAE